MKQGRACDACKREGEAGPLVVEEEEEEISSFSQVQEENIPMATVSSIDRYMDGLLRISRMEYQVA